MNKLREQNEIAEMKLVSDYEMIASALRTAVTCMTVIERAESEEQRQKWLQLARAKIEVATHYMNDLQGVSHDGLWKVED